jgi:hypothetical protein
MALSSAGLRRCSLIKKSRKSFWVEASRILLVYVREGEKYGNVDFNLKNKIAMIIKDNTMKYLKENVI